MSTLAAVNLKNPSSATNNVVLATNGDLQFNSGYGSAATAYGCRAWVNFNGTGTVAIRASGNVSSITDNAAGNYTVNFTTAMADANYSVVGTISHSANAVSNTGYGASFSIRGADAPTASAVRIYTVDVSGASSAASIVSVSDPTYVNVAVFR
jgi:uncharacterized protein (AIM24 family)